MSYEFKREDAFNFADAQHCETREKGDELEFKYCPYCNGGNGNMRDEWTFAINLKKGAFNCFRASCEHKGFFMELCRDFDFRVDLNEPKIYKQLPQVKPQSKSEAVKYLESRGIGEEITRKYNITVDKNNPKILVFPFYDETGKLQFIKYRKTDFKKGIDKNKEWCMKDTMPILFGMNHCHDFEKPLICTEGQIDSLSVAEAGFENAVSVPTGATGFTWLTPCWSWITQFREVIVFGDCEHGKITLLDTLMARLPKETRVKAVPIKDYLGEKDANDILRKYGKGAIRRCIEDAETPKLSNVKMLSDVQAVDLNKMDKIKTGLLELDQTIRGMAKGQLVILTGKRGEGKSTFMSQIVADALDQKRNVFVYSGELADFHFKRWLDYQIAGPNNLQPVKLDYKDGEYDYVLPDDVEEEINTWYRGRAYIYDNNYLIEDGGTEFETLPETIEKAILQYNVELVCIDNLMTAMEAVTEQSNLYLAQSNFVGKLKMIAMKYSVVIILVAHPKKSSQYENQDDNDLVAGSADITNKADIVIKYSRCDPEKYECDSLIKVTKNRIVGRLRMNNDNAIKVFYNEASKRIIGKAEVEQNIPDKRYGWEFLDSWKQKKARLYGAEQSAEQSGEEAETREEERDSLEENARMNQRQNQGQNQKQGQKQNREQVQNSFAGFTELTDEDGGLPF